MPSFPKEVALAEEPAARQSVVGFLRNVNRKSTAVTQDDLWEMIDTDKDGGSHASSAVPLAVGGFDTTIGGTGRVISRRVKVETKRTTIEAPTAVLRRRAPSLAAPS